MAGILNQKELLGYPNAKIRYRQKSKIKALENRGKT